MISEMAKKIYEELARGWNSWDVQSVTAQVLLPQKLRVNVSFVVPSRAGYTGNALWDVIDTFGEHAKDGSYTCVDIKYVEGKWRVETSACGEELLIRVTPLVKRPGGPAFTALEVSGVWGGKVSLEWEAGDRMRTKVTGQEYVIRCLNAQAAPAWDPIYSEHFAADASETVYFTVNSGKSADEIDRLLDERKQEWICSTVHASGDMEVGLSAMRRALLWNMVYESRSGRVITPVSRQWCTGRGRMFGDYVLFDWDTFFGALQYALIDKKLAYAMFFSILEEATPEGMIPNFGCATGPSRDRSEPQVGTLCAMRLYAQFGEKEFLENVFDPLYRWNRWRFEHRDGNKDGLLELGSEPNLEGYDEINSYGDFDNKLACQLESGIDNSTMFDRAVFNAEKHCLEQSYVGLNALMSADCDLLARMADILGKETEARTLRTDRDRLNALIGSELWCEEKHIYLNKSWDGVFDPTLSLTHFYTMLTGAVPQERQRWLMKHLKDENEFWGEYVVPNIARCDASFPEQDYWRGRIWAPTNFLVSEGLSRMGEEETRRDLAQKSMKMFVECWKQKGAVGENYNAITGMAAERPGSDKFYHWGALMVYLAVQQRIDFNAWTGEIVRGNADPIEKIRNIPVKDGYTEA